MSALRSPLRCAVSRADLLRLLAVAPRESLALDVSSSAWFGYQQQTIEPPPLPTIEITDAPSEAPSSFSVSDPLPLKMPTLWAEVSRTPRTPESQEPQPRSAPLDAAAVAPISASRLIGFHTLVPHARLLPRLKGQLGWQRMGAVDIARTALDLAAAKLRAPLPRHHQHSWQPDLTVVLDFSPHLICYRHDMHQLAERLQRLCGRSSISLCVVEQGPLGEWNPWNKPRTHLRRWQMPTAGAALLLVSDFGLHRGASSPEAQDWQRFIQRLKQAKLWPLALAPISHTQLPAELSALVPVLRWSPDASKSPARGTHEPTSPSGLDELLAMAAASRRIDPPLLRALRQRNPIAPHDAGLEGALSSHPDVRGDWYLHLRTDAQSAHLARFAQLDLATQCDLDALRREHHAHLDTALMHEETLLWASHLPPGVELDSAAQERIDQAGVWLLRLGESVADPNAAARGDWLAVATALLARVDGTRIASVFSAPLHQLAAQVQRVSDRLPSWVDPGLLPPLGDENHEAQSACMVLDAARNCLRLQSEPPKPSQHVFGASISISPAGFRVKHGNRVQWYSPRSLPVTLVPSNADGEVDIETAEESLRLAALKRPLGVRGWRYSARGVELDMPLLGTHSLQLSAPDLIEVLRPDADPSISIELKHKFIGAEPKHSYMTLGVDGKYGVFADLYVVGEKIKATQRLRYIEPGEFLMGSRESEPVRYRNEGPQHRVRITQGFWLADSACTQALWLAVMGGKNPSRFSDDAQLPVERVSWDDVQAFLKRLQAQLSQGVEAYLPSEAQWEYACRAGTATPFNLGENISPEQVNYDGNFPYISAATGEDRDRTVVVKSLPANRWGLYEMHGNVWEWCADDQRPYHALPEGEFLPDPIGSTESASRALRGGSWFDYARCVRSAYRSAIERELRSHYIGFRLAFRSKTASRPEGEGSFATERQRLARRDAVAAAATKPRGKKP